MLEIKQNIERLISLYETGKQRQDELAAELENVKAENEAYKRQITELNRQIDNLKLAKAFTGGADNTESKKCIDALIKEIDKCIKLLEN